MGGGENRWPRICFRGWEFVYKEEYIMEYTGNSTEGFSDSVHWKSIPNPCPQANNLRREESGWIQHIRVLLYHSRTLQRGRDSPL